MLVSTVLTIVNVGVVLAVCVALREVLRIPPHQRDESAEGVRTS